MGLARERRSAGDVRDNDGDFLWAQITDGLLGVLGFGRGGLAGAASVQRAPATVFPKSNVRTMTMMRPQNRITSDSCGVTRWSRIDTHWGRVRLGDVIAAAETAAILDNAQ